MAFAYSQEEPVPDSKRRSQAARPGPKALPSTSIDVQGDLFVETILRGARGFAGTYVLSEVAGHVGSSVQGPTMDVRDFRTFVGGAIDPGDAPFPTPYENVTRICQEAGRLDWNPSSIVTAPTGSVAVLFGEGARHAILECDADGDIVAMMTDRTKDDEAESWIVDPTDLAGSVKRVRDFLRGN